MKIISLLFALSLVLLTPGCGNFFKGRKAAEQGVADFHKQYNDGQLEQIYLASDSKMKSATTQKEFLDFVAAVQRKLGKVTDTTEVGFNVSTYNFTTTVVLTQNTTFEQGKGTETFSFQINGDKAVLAGYHINSKDLILK